MLPNLITFQEWNTLKQYGNLTKGFKQFPVEELDDIVVFYDENKQYIDYLARKEIENIIPSYVLVPRFFWDQHLESLPTEYLPDLKVHERIKIYSDFHRESRFRREAMYLNDSYYFDCTMTPRPEQEEPLEFLAATMKENDTLRGVLQAPGGTGKTAMSIKTIHGARVRSLIVVPNEVLQDQWIEAIQEFTNLNPEDIAILQGSDLNKIQEELTDKPIAIIKIQSLFSQVKNNSLENIQDIYKYIDMIVYDECHNTGAASSYAKTSSLFLTGNILGLSATPYRVGLNDYLLKTSIGETIFKLEHNNLTPDIEIHNVWTEFYPKEINKLKSISGEYVMFLGIFNALMKSKDTYFEYLADVVAWNYSQGHNIVVLFATIALMEKLQKNIQERHPEVTQQVLLLKGKTKQDSLDLVKEERKKIMLEYKEYKTELDNKVKAKEIKRKEAQELIKNRRKEIDEHVNYLKEHSLDIYKARVKESSIIISNYNLLSAGFDKPQLSNIIFGAAPRVGKISVIQSIGRITRKHEGKLNPLVQYFIPSTFLDFQKSTGAILNRNIKVQYQDANFKYIGFQK
jgi:superfamily II DNA or RNA helicase